MKSSRYRRKRLAKSRAHGSPIKVMRASGNPCRNARSAGTAHSMSPSCRARTTAMDFGAPSLSGMPGLRLLCGSAFGLRRAGGFFKHERSNDQCIERRGPETLYCIARAAHDRLAARIERGVHQDRDAGELLECPQQIVVKRMLAAIDGLHAGGAVDMAHGRNALRLVRSHIENEQHEWRNPRALKPLGGFIFEHRRRDRPEILAVLDLIQALLHVRLKGERKDGGGAERARPELHAALEPADDFVLRQQLRRLAGD